jgi:hypothetical protein
VHRHLKFLHPILLFAPLHKSPLDNMFSSKYLEDLTWRGC